jgi:replicative DNA helicase
MIRLREVDSSIEKDILIGMIVSNEFLRGVVDIINVRFLDVRPVQIVAGWVLEYYNNYNKAPGSLIEEIYKDKESTLDIEDSDWIKEFLQQLSNEYKNNKFNESYLVNRTIGYLKAQKITKNAKRAIDFVAAGKVDKAEELLYDSMKLSVKGEDLSFNPFDLDKVDELLGEIDREGLTFGIEALDRLIGRLKWGWLFMVLGPPKRGKTWFITEMAVRSALLGLDTLLISLESGKGDSAERIYMNTGSFLSSLDYSDSAVQMPSFSSDFETSMKIRYVGKRAGSVRSKGAVKRKIREILQQPIGRLEVAPFPMYSAGLPEFRRLLDYLWAYKRFSPKVILVDYLGIMKAPKGVKGRDVYDENAKGLKGLAQEREALVCMGMQGSRKMMENMMSIRGSDIPEDIRVLAHVDAGIGLNQTIEEQEEGLMRLNVVAHRWRNFSPSGQQAYVLQQFRVGQSALDSRLLSAPLKSDRGPGMVGKFERPEKEKGRRVLE